VRTAALLLVVALLAGGVAAVAILAPRERKAPEPTPTPAPTPTTPPAPGEWAGSEVCAECHVNVTKRYAKTTHRISTREFTGAESVRPFDGERFIARNLENQMGPGPTMKCEDGPGGKPGRFPVEVVVGRRRVQMFLTTLPGGRVQVLPVFIEVPARKWFDYADFIFGGPTHLEIPKESAYSWYGPHRNYSSRCGFCHMTDFEIRYDQDEGTFDSRFREHGIGCEECHGPGAAHVDKWRRLADGPDPIVNSGRFPVRQANEVCAFCHSESAMVQEGWRPGKDVHQYLEFAGLEDERHLHPDGRAKELIHNYVLLLESRCGPLACTKCHDPHGRGIAGDLYRPLEDDWICTQCHSDFAVNLTEHTHHKAESPGSRCVNCHMPPLVIEGGHGRVRDHTISTPSIANTRELGLPNACRSCHVTEYPGWEYESFDRWYPGAEERNHRVALARAIAGGRARRPEAKDALVALLSNENPVYRAGAAALLAPYDADLRPQLADPDPLVRRSAIDGVALRHPEALEPLLDDASFVLRRAAAIALASRGEKSPYDYLASRPELRARVRAVLEEASHARPDDADLHFLIGELSRLEGRREESARAMERYYRLRPWMR